MGVDCIIIRHNLHYFKAPRSLRFGYLRTAANKQKAVHTFITLNYPEMCLLRTTFLSHHHIAHTIRGVNHHFPRLWRYPLIALIKWRLRLQK